MTEPVKETVDDQIKALTDRVIEQGIEIASQRRALVALGSHVLGGPAGSTKAFMAWHSDQVTPKAAEPAIVAVPEAVGAPAAGKVP